MSEIAPDSSAPGAPERAFDFWIGEWDVHTPDGTFAGRNRIVAEYGGKVLHERYTTDRGYEGESLNMFDAGRGVWHQTWVDNAGTLLVLEGGPVDGAMVMEGVLLENGAPVRQRITWSVYDGGVRQHWQTRAEGGDWENAFDGRYTRAAADGV